MPSGRICRFSLVVDDRQRQPREDLLEKALELVAANFALELEALDAGGHEATSPVPFLEVPQRIPAVTRLRSSRNVNDGRTVASVSPSSA